MKEYLESVKSDMNWASFSKYRSFIMGIGAICVVIFHSRKFIHIKALFPYVTLLNMGVEVFLFVSGIGLYFAYEKNPRFKDFYTKRILNVWLMCLIVSLPYSIIKNFIIKPRGISAFIKGLGGISFFLGEDKINWYIIFAMTLYLVYPLIYKALKLLQKKKLDFPVTLIVCFLWLALCFFLNHSFREFYHSYEVALIRVPVFLLGCYCGKLVYQKKRFTVVVAIAAVVSIVVWLVYNIFFYVNIYSYVSSVGISPFVIRRISRELLGIILIIFTFLFACLVRVKAVHKVINFFGSISLELYLTHYMIYRCLIDLGLKTLQYYLLNVAVSIVLSVLLSKVRVAVVGRYTKRLKAENSNQNQLINK